MSDVKVMSFTVTVMQAEEPKQLVDEASQFHLGRQRNTLQSSALALCFSAAEYCAPVWSRSAHTSRVDVQLNSTMCLISGTLRSTPLPWLPVLSNIEPPALRRKAATDNKLVTKIVKHDSWPIQPDILSPPLLRLTSRKPLWLDLQPIDVKSRWRQQWSLLNRFRMEQGHCGACRRKWRLTDTDLCPCGLWRNPDDVSHCRILSLDKTEWRLISATLCAWRRCFVADQLWLMSRIREEEDCNICCKLTTQLLHE